MRKEEDPKKSRQEASGDTSSIGPTYPPKESSFKRIKGFENRRIVGNRSQILEYAQMIEDMKLQLNANLSRVSFRFIATNDAIAQSLDIMEEYGEVILPLDGAGDGFDDTSMVYLGCNLSGVRDSNRADMDLIRRNIDLATQAKARTYCEIINRVLNEGFTIESPSVEQRMNDEGFRAQMVDLYSRFNWSPEDVINILENPESIFVVIKDKSKIVSAGLAERAEIDINGSKKLRMVELTEAATLEEYQGNGLYTAVGAELLRLVAQLPESDRVHIALGECNGLALGVLKAAKRLGRTLATEVVGKYNLPIGGILPQHVAIDGPKRRTDMNDLVPAFITARDMQRLYANGTR